MKTYSPKISEIKRQWHVIDAQGQVLGRLATQVARLLKGKHKPTYATHLDTGDYVIVVNASQIRVTGNKKEQKTYYRHSGYPKGLKSTNLENMLDSHPERVIRWAVEGMLPKSSLGKAMMRKLKVYASPEHPHQAQVAKEVGQTKAEEATS